MDWDWNGIRHFTALVEKQTLTAAAEHLGVQHSTVSRQIAQLENALGLRLFDRIGKRYLLTPEGERLYRHACEICKDMSMLQRTAREQAELRHSVVISAPPFVARLLLMPHIADFYRKHNDIRLIIQSDAALADLHGRQADIALRLVRPTQNDLAVSRIAHFSYRIYGHEGYLKTSRREDWRFVQIAVNTRFSRWFAESAKMPTFPSPATISPPSNKPCANKSASVSCLISPCSPPTGCIPSRPIRMPRYLNSQRNSFW